MMAFLIDVFDVTVTYRMRSPSCARRTDPSRATRRSTTFSRTPRRRFPAERPVRLLRVVVPAHPCAANQGRRREANRALQRAASPERRRRRKRLSATDLHRRSSSVTSRRKRPPRSRPVVVPVRRRPGRADRARAGRRRRPQNGPNSRRRMGAKR